MNWSEIPLCGKAERCSTWLEADHDTNSAFMHSTSSVVDLVTESGYLQTRLAVACSHAHMLWSYHLHMKEGTCSPCLFITAFFVSNCDCWYTYALLHGVYFANPRKLKRTCLTETNEQTNTRIEQHPTAHPSRVSSNPQATHESQEMSGERSDPHRTEKRGLCLLRNYAESRVCNGKQVPTHFSTACITFTKYSIVCTARDPNSAYMCSPELWLGRVSRGRCSQSFGVQDAYLSGWVGRSVGRQIGRWADGQMGRWAGGQQVGK